MAAALRSRRFAKSFEKGAPSRRVRSFGLGIAYRTAPVGAAGAGGRAQRDYSLAALCKLRVCFLRRRCRALMTGCVDPFLDRRRVVVGAMQMPGRCRPLLRRGGRPGFFREGLRGLLGLGAPEFSDCGGCCSERGRRWDFAALGSASPVGAAPRRSCLFGLRQGQLGSLLRVRELRLRSSRAMYWKPVVLVMLPPANRRALTGAFRY